MNKEEHLLEDISLEEISKIRRRDLIPVWMKIFVWIFMIMGGLALPIFLLGLSGSRYQLALYGFETTKPTSFLGFLIFGLFIYKGIVAYALWFERDWAIVSGIIDAVVGILVCTISMFLFKNTFRVEIIILIAYCIKLLKIKSKWAKVFGVY
jgi:hypothetical protein